MSCNIIASAKHEPLNGNSHKRFVKYVMSRNTSKGLSAQTACFDTVTQKSIFASDFFFKPEELKQWRLFKKNSLCLRRSR